MREIETPTPGDGEVLVRVHAAGIHVGDAFGVRGAPLPLRFMSGLRRPRVGVPGFDIAGTVAAVGRSVTRFVPGDEVVGVCRWPASGACAEYAVAAEEGLVARPPGLSFEEAAAIPTSASAALHGLRDAGGLASGQRVLVIGASGGVGTYAVQIAKAHGAEVTGVCSARNLDLVRSLGADRVIDYTAEDFTLERERYDLVLDNVEHRPLAEVRRVLAPTGTLVLNSGTGASGIGLVVRLIRPLVLSPFSGQRLRRFLSNPSRADLELLVGMAAEGRLRPVIGATYPLAETAAAFRQVESGHSRGKIVISVAAA